MKNHPLPRLDKDDAMRQKLLPHCRLAPGEIWSDRAGGHRVGCLDATDVEQIRHLMEGNQASVAIQDPPYNLAAFATRTLEEFIGWCETWIETTNLALQPDSSLYIWLGADQTQGFQPLPEFMLMMRKFPDFASRSLVTMRNQRGYGTQQNWMAVRQECLYYVNCDPTPRALAKAREIGLAKWESIRGRTVWLI